MSGVSRLSRRAFLQRSALTGGALAASLSPVFAVADRPAMPYGVANGDGPALERELEMADLLRYIKRKAIDNVVWLTADVHYAAAHYYDPNRAQFQDFSPFWEFVSGPLNAGTFGPNDLDNTFGPQVKFQRAPAPGQFDLPPSAGWQFYGEVKIASDTAVMSVMLKDLYGETLYSVDLQPTL